MKSLNQLQVFFEVVQRSQFALAAKHLKISPAAVSKQILALEKELNVQLLTRSTRRVDLTPEGEIYFEHVKKVLEAYEQADIALSEAVKEPSGLLKIVCGPHFAHQHFLPYLKEFLERFPKLILQIELKQSIPNLEKEKIDLILGLSSSIPMNCTQRSLLLARNVLCASPAYLKERGVPKKPSDLAHHHLISHMEGASNETLLFSNGEKIRFNPILSLNDTRAMRIAALEGIGIIEVHDYIVANDLAQGTLIEVLPLFMESKKTIPLFAAYPQTQFVPVKVRKCIDFIVEKIKNKEQCPP